MLNIRVLIPDNKFFLQPNFINDVRKFIKTSFSGYPFGCEDRTRRKTFARACRVFEQYLIRHSVKADAVSARNIARPRCRNAKFTVDMLCDYVL